MIFIKFGHREQSSDFFTLFNFKDILNRTSAPCSVFGGRQIKYLGSKNASFIGKAHQGIMSIGYSHAGNEIIILKLCRLTAFTSALLS